MQAEFGERAHRIRLAYLAFIATLVVAGALPSWGDVGGGAWSTALLAVKVSPILAFEVFRRRAWRCPACTAGLGYDYGPKTCPECRVATGLRRWY